MIPEKTLKAVEYDKILISVSEYAVLKETKTDIKSLRPASDIKEVEFLLKKTAEAFKLLYNYSVPEIYYYEDLLLIINVLWAQE